MTFQIQHVNLLPGQDPHEYAMKHTDGMKELDIGLYARVYADDSTPHVVKVFRGRDSGYLAYLTVMSELQISNPHLPKIYKVIIYSRCVDTGEVFGVVYMEKLTKGKLRDIDVRGYGTGPLTRHQRICQRLRDVAWASNGGEVINCWNRKNKELFTVLQLARWLGKKNDPEAGVDWDLHTGNIMWRGTTFVVTDPLS